MITDHRFVIVLVTTPAGEKGAEIARKVVEGGLASCVNRIANIESTYIWREKLECDGEDLLLIKTARKNLDDLEQMITSLYPYDLPEMIVLPIEGGASSYLDWLAERREYPPR